MDPDPQHWLKLCYLVRFLESRPVDLRNALLQADDEANRVKRRAAEEPVNCTWTIQAKLAACKGRNRAKFLTKTYKTEHRKRTITVS